MNTITNIAWSNVKKNRTRSILIIVSIFTTTLLLMTIAAFGYGLVKMNKDNAGKLHGEYYGSYSGVSEDEIDRMRLRSEFTDIGKMGVLGLTETEQSLYVADVTALSMINMMGELAEGNYPESSKEITAKPEFFKQFGMADPKLGDTVTVSYRENLNVPFAPDTFVISGLLKESENEVLSGALAGYVSSEYYESKISYEDRRYKVYFSLDESVPITSRNGEEVIKELAVKCGIDERFASENFAYLMWKLDPATETIVGCIGLSFVVILFSVIVIYNIFQVGITQKVQEYGKIKALGATKKQMKKIVFREGMLLAIIGIFLGIFGGYAVAEQAFYWVVKSLDLKTVVLEMVKLSIVSVPFFLTFIVIVSSFFAVWIALKKPMKIVSRISPVEAMRYQERSDRKESIRKGKQSMRVKDMTMANLTGNRKRTIATVLSMGLSCVLFITMANVLGNMDPQADARRRIPRGKFEISLKYEINDTAYPENNLDSILSDNPLNEKLLDDIEKLDGVTDVKIEHVLYVDVLNESGSEIKEKTAIGIYSQEDFELELERGTLGDFDYDETKEKNGIIYGWKFFMEESGYSIGKEETLSLFDGIQKMEFSAPVLGAFGGAREQFIMTEDTFRELGLEGETTKIIWVDCKNADTDKVQKGLSELLAEKEHIEVSTYQDALAVSKSAINTTRVGGYIICILIAFMSFMNMANTIITSIVTRKQEFGVLQAIGMTNKQLNRSLQMEGMFFTVGTVLVSLVLGIPMGYGLFYYGKTSGIIGLYSYHFPVWEVSLMVIALATLQIILSFILSRNVKKESLVERIRYQG